MATELATGYVSILPTTRGFTSALTKGIAGSVTTAGRAGGDAGSTFGSRLTSGAVSAVKRLGSAVVTVAKVGATGVAATVAGALIGGWKRLSTIEDSTKSLTVSLGSSAAASKLLGQTLQVVKGTPFPLDSFTQAASTLAAMGTNAATIPSYLTAIANVAATKGSQATEWANRLSVQFGQITAQGKIMGQDILQFAQAGVPALQILANHYGVTTAEMQKMVSEGAVPAEEGLAALTKGIEKGSQGVAGATPAFEGMAKSLGTTVSGAFGNLRAAVSRFGATMLGPIWGKLPQLLDAVSGGFDSLGAGVGEVIRRFMSSQGVTDAFTKAIDWIKTGAPVAAMHLIAFSEGVGDLIDTVKNSTAFQTFLDKLKNISISGGMSAVSSFISGTLVPALKDLKPAAQNLLTFFKNMTAASKMTGKGLLAAAVVGLPAFTTLVNTLSSLIAKVPPGALTAIFAALGTFKVGKAAGEGIRGISDSLTALKNGAKGAKDGLAGIAGKLSSLKTKGLSSAGSAMDSLKLSAMYAKDKVVDVGKALVSSAASAGRWAKQGLVAAANWVKATAAAVANKAAQVAQAAATKIAAAAQVAFNIAMNANPVMLIVVGIAALVAGLVLAYNKVGWFRDFVNAVFSGIKTVVLGVVNFFKTNWSTISAVLTAPFRVAKTIATTVFNAIKTVVSGVIDWVRTNWATISKLISAPIRAGIAIVRTEIQIITATFRAVKNAVGTIIGGIVGFVTGIPRRITGAVSRIAGIIKGPFTTAKKWVSDRIGDIVGFVTGLPGKIKRALVGLGSALWAPFKWAFDQVKKLWNNTVGRISFQAPSWIPGIGGKGWSFPKMHTGGIVPGGPNHEPIYRLQGGEGVIPTDGMAVLAKLFGRTPPPPPAAGTVRSVTGVHADKIVIEDPTTAEQFFRYAEMKMAMAAL